MMLSLYIIGNVITSQTVTIREDAPVSISVVCYIFVLDEDGVNNNDVVIVYHR